MIRKKSIILLGLTFFALALAIFVFAQDFSDITYPVKELGNCRDEKECLQYCDKPANAEVCTGFALEHGLISQEEAAIAKKMLSSAASGPGGCKSQQQCKTYCDDISRIDECLDFAEKEGFMPPDELAEAKAVAKALKQGARLPGNCASKDKCEAYCEDPVHTEECVVFAEAAGFMSPEEASMVRKTGGVGPGGCRGKEKCDAYCNNPDNMEVCVNFAIEHDLMPPDELEEVKMVLEAMKKGVKPPNCRGRDDCDKYCAEPEHAEECVAFAEAAGFMSPEEAEQVKKMMKLGIFSGPGGCRGKDECETYCDDPNNMEECVDFGVKAGFIPPEEAENARKMARLGLTSGPGGCKGKDECEAYCEDPEHGEECMEFAIKAGFMSPEEAEMAKKMMRGGPGGCRGEECKTYCDDPSHQEECFIFAKENNLIPENQLEEMERGMQMMQRGGPGGCRSKEECESYCQDPDHSEECFNWAAGQGLVPSGAGEMMGGGRREGFGAGVLRISLRQDMSGMYILIITNPGGIKEFSFNPQGGGPGYSGGLAGCPREYKTDTSFFNTADFPMDASIVDCQGNSVTVVVSGEGSFEGGGERAPSMPEGFGVPPQEMVPSQEMIQQEMMRQIPEGMTRPPGEEEIQEIIRQETIRQEEIIRQEMMRQAMPEGDAPLPEMPAEMIPQISPQEIAPEIAPEAIYETIPQTAPLPTQEIIPQQEMIPQIVPESPTIEETPTSLITPRPSLLGNVLGSFQRLLGF